MTRLYFHGNCQTRAMAKMMREGDAGVEVRDREVHTIKLPQQLDDYVRDIAWADVIVSQPISETYRSEPMLSRRWVQDNKRQDARLVVFPSLFFRSYTPQIYYLRPLSAVSMPYHDALLVRAYVEGDSAVAAAAQIADPALVPPSMVQRELESALRDLRTREDQTCDVRVSDILEANCRCALLFFTPNHPARQVLWRVLDRALAHAGVAARPPQTGVDHLSDLIIPPLPAVIAALGMVVDPAMMPLECLTSYRLPGREQAVSRADYASELWEHYDSCGGREVLAARLAEEPGMTGFLQRHDAASGRTSRPSPPPAMEEVRPRMKRKLGSASKLIELPSVSSEQEWRAGHDLRWEMIPSAPRLAPAPIVDSNADLLFFLSRTHYAHQAGLWSYPSGTVSRARGRSVTFFERAEGGVMDPKGFYYGTQWLGQARGVPLDIIEIINSEVHIDVQALIQPTARLGEYLLCFDGNWRSYYHWLIDCVSRLFVLMKLSDGKILMPAPPAQLAPFHLESLRRLGIDEDRLVWPDPDQPLVKFQQLLWMNWNPTPWGGIGMLAELGAAYRASVGLGDAPGFRKIYVSRKDGRRRVKHADEIETMMRGLGFDVVAPDRLSFVEQASLFGEASWVVGPHGAGMTNILFAPPGCTVIEFMPDVLYRPAYWGMATSLKQRYGFMVVPGKSFFDDLDVDPARLEAFVTHLAATG